LDIHISKFIKNLSYAIISQLISLLLSISMSLLVPKFLGVEDYSYWQLFVFYSSYVGFFHFGLNDGVYLKHGGTKYKELDRTLIGSQFWFGALFQSVIAFVIIGYASFIKMDQNRSFVIIMTAVYLIICNLSLYLGFVFQAANETKLFSISIMIDKTVYIAAILFLLILNIKNFRIFVTCFLISKVISFTFCLFKGKDIIIIKKVPIYYAAKESFASIKIGMNLMISNIASNLILGSGRYLIDKIWGITSFGKFSFALSLIYFLLLFIGQIGMVLFPELRQLNELQKQKIYKMIRNVLSLLSPIVFLAYIPIKCFVSLWLPQYKDSLNYLSILLPICLFDGKMQILCNTYFKVLRKEKSILAINLSAMLFCIILGLFGTYVLKSIYFIIISMVVTIALRCILSDLYLAKLIGERIYANLVFEIVLVIVFMVSTWYFNSIQSLLIFLVTYILYLAINHQNVKTLWISLKNIRMVSKSNWNSGSLVKMQNGTQPKGEFEPK
jgi:O-antigen/teichoic acid export membrane protein